MAASAEAEVAELLRELELSDTRRDQLRSAADAMRDEIVSMRRTPAPKLADASRLLALYGQASSKAPIPEFAPPPQPPRTIGSAVIGTCTEPDPSADIAVEVPQHLLGRSKAHLDHSFHCTRVAYLSHIASRLRKSASWNAVSLSLQHGDLRKPQLEATHASSCLRVIVHAVPPTGAIDHKRLSKDRGNIKPPQISKDDPRPASPLYNHALLEDVCMMPACDAVSASTKRVPAVREAAIVLKRWFHQRGLLSSADGVGGHALVALAAHLSEHGVLKLAMNAVQALRACLWAISRGHLRYDGAFLGGVNAFGKASTSLLLDIENEASSSYKDISARTKDCISRTLLDGVGSALRSDLIAEASMRLQEVCAKDSDWLQAKDAPPWTQQEREIENLVAHALGTRAEHVRCHRRSISRWPSRHDTSPNALLNARIVIRVALSVPKESFRLVDIGPSNEDKDEAARFRAFWGDKAELRRFKDGTIAEAAVWECPDDERHLIPGKVIEHIVYRHLGRRLESFKSTSGMFDGLLPRIPRESQPAVITQALDTLYTRLTSLRTVPLQVRSLSQISPSMRGTWPAPVPKHPLATDDHTASRALSGRLKTISSLIPCIHALALLEYSAQWPTEREAASMTLTAVAAEAAKELTSQHAIPSFADSECLDAFIHGFAFRVRFRAEGKGPMPVGPQEMHAAGMQGVIGEHPQAAPASRLFARWASSQLFAPHVPHEALEAIVASAFLSSACARPPRSREAGFARALSTLASHEWRTLPLRVPLGDDSPPEAEREQPDVKGMQICTPSDPGSALTNRGPAPAVTARAARLAERSLTMWRSCAASDASIPDAKSAFAIARPALGDFDAVLAIDQYSAPTSATPLFPIATAAKRAGVRLDGWASHQEAAEADNEKEGKQLDRLPRKAMRGGLPAARAATVVGMEPVAQFADEVQLQFEGAAQVFYDPVSPDGLAVALLPSYFKPVEHKAGANGLSNKTKKRKRSGWELYQADPPGQDDILQQMAWFSGDLVKEMYSLRETGMNG